MVGQIRRCLKWKLNPDQLDPSHLAIWLLSIQPRAQFVHRGGSGVLDGQFFTVPDISCGMWSIPGPWYQLPVVTSRHHCEQTAQTHLQTHLRRRVHPLTYEPLPWSVFSIFAYGYLQQQWQLSWKRLSFSMTINSGIKWSDIFSCITCSN